LSKDYYQTLNVDKNATKDEMKKSFRELSKKYHPDHGGNEERFKEINEAYSILSDDRKRSEYDNPLGNFFSGGFPNFFNGFNGFPFGGHRPKNMPVRGKDLRYVMIISLYESICGGDKEFEYNFKDICHECEGMGGIDRVECKTCNGAGVITQTSRSGNVQMINQTTCNVCGGRGFIVQDKCGVCNGSGFIKKEGKLVIKIYPNMADGSVLIVDGKGTSGKNGGPNGDLLVKLKIKIPKKEDLTDEQLEVLKGV
jgi:molecular chaperone DnaJ